MKNSTIETGDIYINHNELFEDGSLVENSTIKASNILFNNQGDYTIINSRIDSTSFYSAYSARFFFDKSKITTYDRIGTIRLGSFNHSYILINTSNQNNSGVVNAILKAYNGVNYVATDLENNILEPQHMDNYCDSFDPNACNNFYFTEYPLVLIRDKVNIKFKIENGSWEDGSSDDIEYELFSFDKLSIDQIPTNMVAKDGYENGSWDSELMYDELNDDYVFTYSFKKKGFVESVKGVIEQLNSNPKTGSDYIKNTITVSILLAIMSSLYFITRKYHIFKKY